MVAERVGNVLYFSLSLRLCVCVIIAMSLFRFQLGWNSIARLIYPIFYANTFTHTNKCENLFNQPGSLLYFPTIECASSKNWILNLWKMLEKRGRKREWVVEMMREKIEKGKWIKTLDFVYKWIMSCFVVLLFVMGSWLQIECIRCRFFSFIK